MPPIDRLRMTFQSAPRLCLKTFFMVKTPSYRPATQDHHHDRPRTNPRRRIRHDAQSRTLGEKLAALNDKRIETFGSTQMEVIGRTRIRTENNCVPRDIMDMGLLPG